MRLHRLCAVVVTALALSACNTTPVSPPPNGGSAAATAGVGGATVVAATPGRGGSGDSGGVTVGSLQIVDVWARATSSTEPAGGTMNAMISTSESQSGGLGVNAAAYMTIRNSGSAPDRLLKIQGDLAGSVELHSTTEQNGVMRMNPVTNVDLPAGGTVAFKPGGLHAMMIGLTRDLKPGDTISLKLTFEKAGEVTVQASVRGE